MKYLLCGLVIGLLVVHQDNWFWDDPHLVFGFLPIGLAYHAGISIAAAVVWWLAIQFCWPVDSAAPGEPLDETHGGN